MRYEPKVIDTFQIVGFIVSVTISIVLVLAKQDTVASVTLGLVLATLTQLFDLQLRNNATEEKLLQANNLQRSLYEDVWLLRQIEKIVADYHSVKGRGFPLFSARAEDAISDCRNVLHSMAEGYMVTEAPSAFTIGNMFKDSQKSIKHVITRINPSYMRSSYYEKALQVSESAIKRGVEFTRIYLLPSNEFLYDIQDILVRQQKSGIRVLVVFPDPSLKDLYEDYIVVDDCFAAQLAYDINGDLKEQQIFIDPVIAERFVKKFDILLRYTKKFDDAFMEIPPDAKIR